MLDSKPRGKLVFRLCKVQLRVALDVSIVLGTNFTGGPSNGHQSQVGIHVHHPLLRWLPVKTSIIDFWIWVPPNPTPQIPIFIQAQNSGRGCGHASGFQIVISPVFGKGPCSFLQGTFIVSI